MTLFEIGSYLERKSDELSLWLLHTDLGEIFVIIFLVTPLIFVIFWLWIAQLGWMISSIKDNKKEHIIFGMKFEKFKLKDIAGVFWSSLFVAVSMGAIIPLLK